MTDCTILDKEKRCKASSRTCSYPSLDAARPVDEWVIDQQGPPEQQTLRHQTPRTPIGALRAVVAQAQEMVRLHIIGPNRQAAQRTPIVRIAEIDFPVGVLSGMLVGVGRVVGVAPQADMGDDYAAALDAHACPTPI